MLPKFITKSRQKTYVEPCEIPTIEITDHPIEDEVLVACLRGSKNPVMLILYERKNDGDEPTAVRTLLMPNVPTKLMDLED